jgi:copper transport protein
LGLLALALLVDRHPALATAAGAIAVAGFAASGHTRAGEVPRLTTVTDVVHLLVVAAWAGGLVLLWLSVRARRGPVADEQETVGMIGRFSSLATISIAVVGMSGAVLGWKEVGSIDALTSTTYGRTLLAKVACVGVVAVLGAYNHFRLVPALRAGKVRAALAQLHHTLRSEVLVLVAVVALTAVLVVVTPGRSLSDGGVVERVAELGDVGSVQVTVAPATTGFNQIHLYLFDTDDRPADLAERVTLRFTLPSADLGPFDREAVRAGPAHFQLDGDDLAVGGTWTIEVHARIDQFTEEVGTVEIPIAG